MNQPEHDERSLALHRMLCDRLRADPGLLARARSTLTRWAVTDGARFDRRWEALLASDDPDPIITAATDPSEAGDALRQSSPLVCLLEPRERWRWLKAWRESRGA